MNERIQELLSQAGVHYEVMPKGTVYDKFAELIVRECLGDLKERIALRYQGDEKDRHIAYGMEIVYFDILDKFGVE